MKESRHDHGQCSINIRAPSEPAYDDIACRPRCVQTGLQVTGRCCIICTSSLFQACYVQCCTDMWAMTCAAQWCSLHAEQVRRCTLMTATSLKKESIAFSVSGGGGGAMPASTSLFASVALKLRAPLPCPPCAHIVHVVGLPAHSNAPSVWVHWQQETWHPRATGSLEYTLWACTLTSPRRSFMVPQGPAGLAYARMCSLHKPFY